MEMNVKMEPFWRVVRFKNRYWVQLFDESGDYKTFTKSTNRPERKSDYLVVKSTEGSCYTIIYLAEKEQVAVPLFITQQFSIKGNMIRFSYCGQTFFWEPSMLSWSHQTPEHYKLDCGNIQTHVCCEGSKKAKLICAEAQKLGGF